MRTYVKTYDLSKWIPPKAEVNFCLRNNFSRKAKADGGNHESLIKEYLKECLEEQTGYLLMAHDGNKYTGWGLAYKTTTGIKRKEFQCYVLPRARRKGVGSRLLKRACSILGRVEVFAHEVSNKFYEANGLTAGEAITGKRLKKL